jgi:HK97 family phage major capsid protein
MEESVRKIIESERFFRKSDIVSGSIDEAARTVDMSFSSELPVQRSFGMEILDHSEGSADLSRLNAGAAVLVDHGGDQIGVVKKAFIDPTTKRGMAKLKFSKSARGQEIFQDIVDGIRSNISFAYSIDTNSMTKESEGTYRMSKWTPHEISVVGVPADATVGIGRSLEKQPEVQAVEVVKEEVIIEEKQKETILEIKTNEGKNKMEDKKRVSEIFAIAEKHPELMAEARAAITSDTTLEDFQKTAMAKLYNAKAVEVKTQTDINASNIGLSTKEVKSFSIARAIQAMVSGNKESAAFEFEASRACAKKAGKDPQGFYVPNEVRTMNVTSATAGGDFVATDLLAGSMIELLRNKSVMFAAGCKSLTGLVGDVAIPKQSGGGSAYWIAEGVDPTVSDQTITQVAMAPKTLGCYTDFTRKLMLQSSVDIESFVRSDLTTIQAIELDRAILNGSGAGSEPSGLYAKITGAYVPSLGTNGGAPTWASIVALEARVDAQNALAGSLSYITNAKVRGTLKSTPKVSNFPQYLMDDSGRVNGYTCHVSNQVPGTITKAGSGATLSAMIFGNFSDIIVGFWGYLDVKIDPYALSKSGGIRVIVLQDLDTNVRHIESFSALKDIVTI